jgi:NAD(P)-dependent dehydrogenase (short-subunit alcohol dehydrogenase family)
VVGASGGIGRALVEQLLKQGGFGRVFALSRSVGQPPSGAIGGHIDVVAESTIAQAAEAVAAHGPVGLIVVATGLLHADGVGPEKTWRALDPETLARLFAVNTIGPALVAKHFLPLLPRDRRSVFAALSARVGSVSDNRLGGWYGYRASKAALNQIVRTLAIELVRSRPAAICVALHPGTVATELSRPFRSGAEGDRLFTPAVAAGHLLGVLDGLTPADTGGLFAWDGAQIPF